MKVAVMVLVFAVLFTGLRQKDQNEKLRESMVAIQIRDRGITDPSTIKAMSTVPRHLFVPDQMAGYAYSDSPIPIGHNQTISQPFIVAWMTELAQPSKYKKALEIGTGSGYQAAVLAEIVSHVYTIEIVPELAKSSAALLKKLGYTNITAREGDGYTGWEEHAPFDIIMVTAACDHVPQPLIDQLAENGRLIVPVGDPGSIQELTLITKKRGTITRQTITPVRFVPLIRKQGSDTFFPPDNSLY
ncbi:MAG: protein-L-isoaspartate(D-aspartate) O-methyltransferase [Bacteroidales bacterium]|jgi:protein-L-isoaspartate(D-aspartate) O-methyltransferase|nr:protein-L-isoaspartate(D-aspartate) O-methyltransferase [Bacteroidales bacterium]